MTVVSVGGMYDTGSMSFVVGVKEFCLLFDRDTNGLWRVQVSIVERLLVG